MKKAFLIELAVLKGYLKQLVPLLIFMAVMMALGMNSLVAVPGACVTMAGVMGSISTNSYDQLNNWGSFRLTLPVSRRDVVLGRYAMVLFMFLLSIALSALIIAGFTAAWHIGVLPRSFEGLLFSLGDLWGMVFATASCMMVGVVAVSVTLPIYFRFGMTKASQYIPFIIMGSVFAFSFVISALPDAVKALVRDNIAFVMQPENTVVFSLLLIGISALSYCASALVSLAVCAKRDY